MGGRSGGFRFGGGTFLGSHDEGFYWRSRSEIKSMRGRGGGKKLLSIQVFVL